MKKIVMSGLMAIVLIIALQFCAKAQGPGDPGDDPDVPLDPGSWVLVAAGVGYGIKKWRDSKQKINKNGDEIAGFIENENQINP